MLNPVMSNCTRPKYVCGNHQIKLIGTTDGLFPDFGHHLEKEMGGLWLYPIKIIDGFWMKIIDHASDGLVEGYMEAGSFENHPHKNVFHYSGQTMGHTPITITRTQIIPDKIRGIKIIYDIFLPIKDANANERKVTFDFLTRINLRPDWLAEGVDIFNGTKDEVNYLEEKNIFVAKDNKNSWYACVGGDFKPDEYSIGNEYSSEITNSNGESIRITKELTIKPGETKSLIFYVTGSKTAEEDCILEYKKITKEKDFETEKKDVIEKLLSATNLKVKDKSLENIFDWIKVHTEWLTLEIEGIGKGITAGIPEYVWWFGCDSCYALQGIMMQGNYELCESTIRLILEYSQKYNGNGRIIHEILPNGFSPNYGNTQETAQFIYLLWEYYKWTGNRVILEECFEYISKSVEWLLLQDDDNDYFPTGYGIIEIAGLNLEMIDTAAYTCVAYECYAKISKILGKNSDIEKWENMSKEAAKAINENLWDKEEGLYCDCFASSKKILEKQEMILEQMEESKNEHVKEKFLQTLERRNKDLDKEYGWVLNKNWVINVPMEVGIAETEKANKALARMHTEEFIGEYGMYLEGLRKQATMTISTGVMAVSQVRYGYADRALELIKKMFKSYSVATPGSISEMSPDYGCFVQAWTAYGAVVPIVKYFFGIQPDAANNKIIISPILPTEWEEVSLENVRVLDGNISIQIVKKNDKTICKVKNNTSASLEFVAKFDSQIVEMIK